MTHQCTNCGANNSVGARYCDQCGATLSALALHPLDHDAERRQLTVMFCDVVASTQLARLLQDEDYRDLLGEYQALCSAVVSELGGVVAQYLGDGVLVYFGYPTAHEDGPSRCSEAALRILDRTKSLNTRLNIALPFPVRVRIGIHTGLVLVSKVGGERQENLALGQAPNLAARLQQAAEPDTIVISEATQRLIAEDFETRALGATQLKGFDQPMQLFSVVHAHSRESRSQLPPKRVAPMIGREAERAELMDAWQSVLASAAVSGVVIEGEPGIGKSHQAQAFKQSVIDDSSVVEGNCSLLHQNAMLYPIAGALSVAIGASTTTDAETKFALLQRYLSTLELPAANAVYLAPVLGGMVPEELALPTLPPQVRRQRMMQSLIAWLGALARRAPVLLMIEDLQWADPSTLELLQNLLTGADVGPIMILATSRLGLMLEGPAERVKIIALRRLTRELAERVVEHSAGQIKLPASVVDRIIELADGVPFYLEEVTRAIMESDALRRQDDRYELTGTVLEPVVPATVHDSLMARLDRTADGRLVAQIAAVLGREFSERVLRAVWLMNEANLDSGIRRLLQAELIVPASNGGDRSFRFKHALIQETAYQSLIRRRRQQYHHHAASVLRDIFPELAKLQPHVIALHYVRAKLPALAASSFEAAGKAAFDAQAYVESINHYRSALAQLRLLPEDAPRNRRELELLSALGLPLLMTRGYAAPEVGEVYDRALALCSEVEPPLRILFGIWGAQISRGEPTAAAQMVEMFKTLAAGSRSSSERLIALAAIGSHAFWCARISIAVDALTQAARAFEPDMFVSLPRDYGYDNPLYPYLYLIWALSIAGRFAEAQSAWAELWALTKRANVPYLTVMSLAFGASIADEVGDLDLVLELASRGMTLAVEHQLNFWLSTCNVQHGSALSKQGKLEDGIREIEQGVGMYKAIGAFTGLSISQSKLSYAYYAAGQLDRAWALIESTLALTEKNLDCLGVPELWRIKALILASRGDAAQAHHCFVTAIECARANGAVLHELRAATSYAKFLYEHGERAAAADWLRAACSKVSNGDVPVFRAARDLLKSNCDAEPTPAALE